MKPWQIQEATSRFSEVVQASEPQGPQNIIANGRSVAVGLSRADFDQLCDPGESLVDFSRDTSLAHEIERRESVE